MSTERRRPCVYFVACGNLDDPDADIDGGMFPLCKSCFQRQVQRRKRKKKAA